jgi:ATP/maltotriose-dependent transcriptional regulator MalT
VLTRASGDTSNEAWTLLSLGQLALAQADLTTAQKQLEEGLDLSRRTSESSAIAYALTLLGWTTLQQGKFDEAHTRLKESLQLYREQGNRWGIARSLLLFAHLTTAEGDLAEARARYQESLSTAREMGFKGFTASGLKGLGVVVAAQGQFSWAAQLWGAAEQLREGRDVSLPAALYEQSVEAARTHLGEQALVTALAEGRMMTPEQVLAAKVMAPTPVPARPASASPMKSPPYPAGLTGREMEVLRLMAQGMTNPHIAERLIISLHTVNAHVRSIYTKLELNSRSALTRYALEHHLL